MSCRRFPQDGAPDLPVRWEGETITSRFEVRDLGNGRDIVKITMVGTCRLCRYATGTCTVGMRKIHDRTDPACRLHGMTSAATTPPRARTRTPPREGEQQDRRPSPPRRGSTPAGTTTTSRGSSSTRPLAELTGFRTRQGVVLFYEPSPLDTWIGKKIQKAEGGTFTDMESGGTLTKQEARQHKAYGRRHKARNEDARLPDKVLRCCTVTGG